MMTASTSPEGSQVTVTCSSGEAAVPEMRMPNAPPGAPPAPKRTRVSPKVIDRRGGERYVPSA